MLAQQPTIVPIVSNMSIIQRVMRIMITVKSDVPSGMSPSVKTLANEPNTLYSPVKKFAKFSQNFQDTVSLPARIEIVQEGKF